MQTFPFFHNSAVLFFSEIIIFMIKTSCRPIWSVIILVINKSDFRCEVVRFRYHSSCDIRLNWTSLSPITRSDWIMQFKSFHWLGNDGIWAIMPCSTNVVIVCVAFCGAFKFILFLFSIILGLYFNKTIIPVALVGYELVIFHLIPCARSLDNF